MYFEMITPIWWKFELGKWWRTRDDQKDFEEINFPEGSDENEFWRKID
jgi:hypothetical protein